MYLFPSAKLEICIFWFIFSKERDFVRFRYKLMTASDGLWTFIYSSVVYFRLASILRFYSFTWMTMNSCPFTTFDIVESSPLSVPSVILSGSRPHLNKCKELIDSLFNYYFRKRFLKVLGYTVDYVEDSRICNWVDPTVSILPILNEPAIFQNF